MHSPDLATRTLVRRVVDALRVRCFALTDYNPHGVALMLTYKLGTARYALEQNASCPALQWLGLRAADVVQRRQGFGLGVGSTIVEGSEEGLPADAFQPFTARDRAVLTGLMRRPAVNQSEDLMQELRAMEESAFKVEIEALYCRGFEFLSRFIQSKIVHHDDESSGDDSHAHTYEDRAGWPAPPWHPGVDEDESRLAEANETEESGWYGVDGTQSPIEALAHQPSPDDDETDDWLFESAPDW